MLSRELLFVDDVCLAETLLDVTRAPNRGIPFGHVSVEEERRCTRFHRLLWTQDERERLVLDANQL